MRLKLVNSRTGRIARAADLIRNGLEIRSCLKLGVPEIDEILPWGGLPRGLHDIALPPVAGPGDAAPAGFAALLATRRPGPVLWCRLRRAAEGDPYGLGMASFGLAPGRLILVEVRRQADLLWAMEEGARTRGLAAVVGEGAAPDLTAGRRLQLAAEAGEGLVLSLPPPRAFSSSALTGWRVNSEPSAPEAGGPGRPRWRLSLWRCRGGRPQDWIVEWDDAAFSLSVAPALANRPLAAAAG